MIPRVEALRTSTLGWEIATPTELPLGGVLAHIISTHSKDGDSQWPKLWAGKTVGLGKRNSIRFPLCAVTFGLELPLGT